MNILFFTHPGTNSKLIFEDIIQGYVDCGVNAFRINLFEMWKLCEEDDDEEMLSKTATLFTETVRRFIEENDIDFSVCMWANAIITLIMVDGKNFFEDNKTPILMHWLDAPQWAHTQLACTEPPNMFNGDYCYHYINNDGMAMEMKKVLEFKHVISLPNASPALVCCNPTAKVLMIYILMRKSLASSPSSLMSLLLMRRASFWRISRKLGFSLSISCSINSEGSRLSMPSEKQISYFFSS